LLDVGDDLARRVGDLRRLWTGTTLSSVGTAMTAFAVIFQVYNLTGSSLAVGALGVAQMVPTLTAGLVCGPVVDAIDRRKLVLLTSTCLALVSAALTVQAFAGLDLLWLLYALVAVQSSLAAVDRPARNTFVPALLLPGQLAAGLAPDAAARDQRRPAGAAAR
jgi:MFS family permease